MSLENNGNPANDNDDFAGGADNLQILKAIDRVVQAQPKGIVVPVELLIRIAKRLRDDACEIVSRRAADRALLDIEELTRVEIDLRVVRNGPQMVEDAKRLDEAIAFLQKLGGGRAGK
jgi:hypothetical protein